MASSRNSSRKKRKYSDKRRATTEKNRAARKERAFQRTQKMFMRTQALMGRMAVARTKEGPVKGHVTDVIWDKDTLRNEGVPNPVGIFLVISPVGSTPVLRARRRVKVL